MWQYSVVLKDDSQFIGRRGFIERWNEPYFGFREYKVMGISLDSKVAFKVGDTIIVPVSSINYIIKKGGK